jgi:enoyl-CoA hydratase/carnithine racemase
VAETVVLYERDDKVSVITLNRPEKLNAISPELMQQLLDAFARADEEPATSVVLLRAEGRSFCAGYDIGAGPARSGAATRSRRTSIWPRNSHSR